MKTISKESIIRGFRYFIDLALIIQCGAIIFVIIQITGLISKSPSQEDVHNSSTIASMSSPPNNIMMAFSNPNLAENIPSIKKNFLLFSNLCGLLYVIALILITVQLRYIFKSFSREDYFNSSNSVRIKKIAIIIFFWVIADYAIRFIPDFTIPLYFVHSSIGVNSLSDGIRISIFHFNLKMLIVSIIIYILSIVFKYGNNLKEESSLTI